MILFLAIHCSLIAQQWSVPVAVSSISGYNMDPDFIIDNDNKIHVVWNYKVANNFWKIFYSVSYDGGISWSEAVDVLQNNSLWMSQPHIGCDSDNNLYVTYDHKSEDPSQVMVYIIRKIDGVWGNPELVSIDMYGSSYNNLIIDNEDRLYVFWYHNSKTYYKHYENNTWSEPQSPYDPQNLITSLSFDSLNNLHCSGGYWTTSPDKIKLSYYYYNKAENLWASPEIITSNFIEVDQDIDVDYFGYPHLTWRERDQVPLPENDYTFYRFYDGTNWSEIEMVVEDPWEQQISIDKNNDVHIVDREKLPVGWQLVHHSKVSGDWSSILVDSSEILIARPELLQNDVKLYLVFDKTVDVSEENLESIIYMTNLDIQTDLKDIDGYNTLKLNLFPNPANEIVNIEFELKKSYDVNLYIFSLNGEFVVQLENCKLDAGSYHYIWDCKNDNISKINSGMYLCRLHVGKIVITRSIQLINLF